MSKLALQLIEENIRTKSPFLDLGKCGLTALPDELSECKDWLVRLNLGFIYRNEDSKWEISKNSREKNIFNGDELFSLVKLVNLKVLYLNEIQISDISFLEKLTNLNSLYLSSNQISDISFLEKLTNLNSLDLRYNQISDISFGSTLKVG
jgi:internalin A